MTTNSTTAVVVKPVRRTAKQRTWTSRNGMDFPQLTRSSAARRRGGSVAGIASGYRDPTDVDSPDCNNRMTSGSARLADVNTELVTLRVDTDGGVAVVTIDHPPVNLL